MFILIQILGEFTLKYLKLVAGAAALALVAVTPASAATWTWSSARTVTKIYPYSNGYYFFLDGSVLNSSSGSCSVSGSNYMVLHDTDGNYYGKMSGLLTAFANAKQIVVIYDSDPAACWTPIDRFQVIG